jgi:hypothetical protein
MYFTVRRAGVEHEPIDSWDAFSVGLDDGGDEGQSILFMRSSDDDVEADPEADPYCIGVTGGMTHYGGIITIRLERGQLQIELEEPAARVLGADSAVWTLPLEISDDSFDALKAGLRRVFAGSIHGPSIIGF